MPVLTLIITLFISTIAASVSVGGEWWSANLPGKRDPVVATSGVQSGSRQKTYISLDDFSEHDVMIYATIIARVNGKSIVLADSKTVREGQKISLGYNQYAPKGTFLKVMVGNQNWILGDSYASGYVYFP